MKRLLLFMCCCTAIISIAQTPDVENEIRRLEKAQCDAIVARDTATLFGLWAQRFTVNSPTNDVVKLPAAKQAVRLGLINYSVYEHKTEEIMNLGNVILTMGSEKIIPRAGAPMAGETVFRRYTQVWTKEEGSWKLAARHAHMFK